MSTTKIVYGVKKARFAPMLTEPDGALPTYGPIIDLSELAQCNQSITYSNAQAFGDNRLVAEVNDFVSAQLDIQTLGMPPEVARALYGAEGTDEQVIYSDSDVAPLGGVAYYKSMRSGDGKNFFEACYYPKAQATRGNDNATTKGSSTTFQNRSLSMKCTAPKFGQWEITEEFATEAEADAWCNEQLGATGG